MNSDVYIQGGYQSADVILTDLTTGQPVPLGGAPSGSTLLKPNTNYGFSAQVHNESNQDVNDLKITFWAIDGGVGTNGIMVGTPQTVAINKFSSPPPFAASAPFKSAPLNNHICAVVSIYNPAALGDPANGCAVDATTALQIPDPVTPTGHACSAWRNTDSMTGFSNAPFVLELGAKELPFPQPNNIALQVQPVLVPFNWEKQAKVKEIKKTLGFFGAENTIPLYLHPSVMKTFKPINLKAKIEVALGGKMEAKENGKWYLTPSREEKSISFKVSGQIPEDAKVGDIVLVKVTAHHPKSEKWQAKSVEFLEFIHIIEKTK